MNGFKRYLPIVLLILITFTGNGCLKKPTLTANDFGGISIMFSIKENNLLNQKGLVSDIQAVKISLTHKNKNISKEQQFPFNGGIQQINFNGLYPGEWQINAIALDMENDTIFQGSSKTLIQPGNINQVQFPLLPSPGVLNVSLDASQIPGFGTDFTKGTLYVYFDPENNDPKYYTLSPDGKFLKAEVTIPEGSYQIKVAAPNVSAAVYTSPYYTINIRSGKSTNFTINPDCTLEFTGEINSTPATPANLNASYQSESSSVLLTWSPVWETDLAGYRLYRTNNEGRLVRIMSLQSNMTSYTDTVSAGNFYQGTIGYAVSSYDLGGYESFWSEMAVVEQ